MTVIASANAEVLERIATRGHELRLLTGGVVLAVLSRSEILTSDLLREERRRSLAKAIASLERALELGPPYGHAEDPKMSRKNIEERLLEWHLELQEI